MDWCSARLFTSSHSSRGIEWERRKWRRGRAWRESHGNPPRTDSSSGELQIKERKWKCFYKNVYYIIEISAIPLLPFFQAYMDGKDYKKSYVAEATHRSTVKSQGRKLLTAGGTLFNLSSFSSLLFLWNPKFTNYNLIPNKKSKSKREWKYIKKTLFYYFLKVIFFVS